MATIGGSCGCTSRWSNVLPSGKKIDWRPIPPWMRAECKAVTYRYRTEGPPGMRRPVVRFLVLHLVQAAIRN